VGAEIVLVSEEADAPSASRAGSLRAALEILAARGLSSVTVEGGAMLHRSLWDAGLVDRVQIFRTPRRLGELGIAWLPSVAAGDGLQGIVTTPLGADTLIEGYVYRSD
jgi:riboflavin biosynthesis pyrimidine reductase